MTARKLEMILERDAAAPDGFTLYACRGAGKGCKRNVTRNSKKRCDDCVKCDNPNETLGEIEARLARGDA